MSFDPDRWEQHDCDCRVCEEARAEAVRLRQGFSSDEAAEAVSRLLNPQAWEIIGQFKPDTREEYEIALRAQARRALWSALDAMPSARGS
jgi:hypothetical protein